MTEAGIEAVVAQGEAAKPIPTILRIVSAGTGHGRLLRLATRLEPDPDTSMERMVVRRLPTGWR